MSVEHLLYTDAPICKIIVQCRSLSPGCRWGNLLSWELLEDRDHVLLAPPRSAPWVAPDTVPGSVLVGPGSSGTQGATSQISSEWLDLSDF